ncbi:MAG TPA: LysM peptidoglycan-binding domain-containing M23 family metallopeptidase [Novosphingobium sp.]|nr:LysM peptidoglycan-binding domain-containing M23 family metallopeptidase [Novosphingobium sp.]
MRRPGIALAAALLAASTSAVAAPPEQETEHLVASGETLNGIANRAGVSRQRIIEANGLKEPYVVRLGQKLKIPRDGRPASRVIQASRPAKATIAKAATAKATATTPDGASGVSAYVVQPGETLGGIANREQVPRVMIAEANGMTPPYTVRAGQKLLIPRTRHHVVSKGETGFSIAYDYAVPWETIAVANNLQAASAIKPGQKLLIPAVLGRPDPAPAVSSASTEETGRFAWPLAGTVRRGFRARGVSDYHDGIDIIAAKGAAVRASAAGTVLFAGKEEQQFGNLVVVDHGGGWASAYGSLDKVTVKKGDRVGKGERVGLVGSSGITGATELHFEMRRDNTSVDPLEQLPEKP